MTSVTTRGGIAGAFQLMSESNAHGGTGYARAVGNASFRQFSAMQ